MKASSLYFMSFLLIGLALLQSLLPISGMEIEVLAVFFSDALVIHRRYRLFFSPSPSLSRTHTLYIVNISP